MVIKVKVSDVAKDFGKSNKEIIELLDKYCGGPAKKASTVLEENELNILFDKITIQNSVKSFDAYFKSGAAKAKKKNPLPKSRISPQRKRKRQRIKSAKARRLFANGRAGGKARRGKGKEKSRGSAPGPHKGRGSPYRHSC